MFDKIRATLGILPVTVINAMVEFWRFPFAKKIQERLLENVHQVIEQLQNRFPNDDLVITGHGFGGAFAEVVAARLRLPAVGFAVPGQYYLMKQFGWAAVPG